MRTISTADDQLFTKNGGRATYLRVDVQDSGSVFRDMTTYPGKNMVLGAEWSDNVDDEGQHGSVTLKREEEQLSLAPFMTKSPLNLGFVFGGTYAALLQVGRGVRIYTADIPSDAKPAVADWRFMFDGYIDSVDAASGESITLEVSDLQGKLRDTWIEAERVYSYAQGANATKGCRVWSSLMLTVAGELLIPTEANRNGHFYSTSGGSSAGSPEPAYPTGSGATVVDNTQTLTEKGATSNTVGTAVETIMNQIIADNGVTIPTGTVQIPGGSPAWNVKWFLQQRQSVWDAVRALSDQIGWDLRFLWDSGSNSFLLSLWSPNRAKVSPDRSFGPGEKWAVKGLKTDVSEIRNVVQVVFSASGSVDPSGNPLRITLQVSDATSIAKYGRRFMEIGEASTSNVDTSAEATAMATAALNDLKEPNAVKQVDLPYFPFVQLGDLYRFTPDAIFADGNLDLAIKGYQHSVTTDGPALTTLTCAGKPAIGTARWLAQSGSAVGDDIHRLAVVDGHGVQLAASSVVGGTLLTAATAYQKLATGQDLEWHVGTTAGFTPDSTTILQGQGGNQVTAPHLIPGGAYYAKVVPVRRNASRIFRGMPSAALAFTAGRASAGHLQDGIALGDYPLNGGFETRLDVAGMPDWWTVFTGTLGTHVTVVEDTNGLSGNRYMRLVNSGGVWGGIKSAAFPIVNEAYESSRFGQLYYVTWWRKAGASNSAGSTYDVLIELLNSAGGQVNVLTMASGKVADNKTTHWVKEELYVPLRAGDPSTRSARLIIQGRAGATFQLDVDEYRVVPVGTEWYDVGAFGGASPGFTDNYEAIPNYVNSWATFSAGSPVVSFRKDRTGRVFMKGACAGGTALSTIFTLPLGYRPSKTHTFNSPDAAAGLVSITSAGLVNHQQGTNTQVRFDQVSFMTYP